MKLYFVRKSYTISLIFKCNRNNLEITEIISNKHNMNEKWRIFNMVKVLSIHKFIPVWDMQGQF